MHRLTALIDTYSLPLAALAAGMSLISDAGAGDVGCRQDVRG